MPLRTRFMLLLLILGGAVAVNVGATVWAILTLERELSWPLTSVQQVMGHLATIKRTVGELHNTLPVPPDEGLAAIGPVPSGGMGTADGDPVGAAERAVGAALRGLRTNSDYAARSGPSMLRNLEERLTDSLANARAALAGDGEALRAARAGLFNLHELIEAAEGRILSDAGLAVSFGRQLRGTVVAIAAIALLPLAPAAWLAVRLVRRGVLEPVSDLRRATLRLAAGDFSHRVPVRSNDELGALSAEVNHMAGMIVRMHEERVDRERLAAVGEMTRRIVHNLRNPLAGIRGLAELTRQEVGANESLRENQDRIISAVDRFERWLNELLTATKPLEVARLRCEVGPWLRAVVEGQGAAAAARSVRLRAAVEAAPPQAEIDPRHLEQAAVALVANAIEAAPPGSEVVVSASADGGEFWEIRVADQGPGVPGELREKIFRPYFTTKAAGTGIGLALVRQIGEQHGGRVWVEDAPSGSGAVFVMRMSVSGPAGGGTGVSGGENSRH